MALVSRWQRPRRDRGRVRRPDVLFLREAGTS